VTSRRRIFRLPALKILKYTQYSCGFSNRLRPLCALHTVFGYEIQIKAAQAACHSAYAL